MFRILLQRSAAIDIVCRSLKINARKTAVGTPRCGVRSAQRADPTIQVRRAICVIRAPKITSNVLGNLNVTRWLIAWIRPKLLLAFAAIWL